jgi:para-nitrobenzyl esterase
MRGALRALSGVDETLAPILADGYRPELAADVRRASDKELFDAFASDAFFRVPALRLAEAQSAHAPVYCYRFDWSSSFLDGRLGACHGLELPFVFGTLGHPAVGLFAGAGAAASALSERMRACWTHFAKVGRPTPSASDWPTYLPGRVTMCFGEGDELLEAPGEAPRLLWETMLGEYGRATPARYGGT